MQGDSSGSIFSGGVVSIVLLEVQRMTTLTQIREATLEEQKNEAAEVIFTRKDRLGQVYIIYGSECYESWLQWGAPKEVLGDNVDDIEKWQKGSRLKGAVEFDQSLLEEMVDRLKKPDVNKPVFKISPEFLDRVNRKICPICEEKIREEDFRDALSKKEYSISGLCQECQDEVF